MMKERRLPVPDGYDLSTQRTVALFATQLDDQLSLLKNSVAGLRTVHLEWQPQPGFNTVGMLLAHLAVVETFWINIAAAEIPLEPDGDNLILRTIGIRMDDDGLPQKPDGRHPGSLCGKTLDDYLEMLDKARRAVHATMRTWHDTDLESTYLRADRDLRITRSWTLYHVLEHFAAHFGQILLLKHMMRDAGLLAEEPE